MLMKWLVLKEVEKICNLRNQYSGEHLMRFLDNAQITSLSNDISWILRLRLFCFTIGSSPSPPDFKEILEVLTLAPEILQCSMEKMPVDPEC